MPELDERVRRTAEGIIKDLGLGLEEDAPPIDVILASMDLQHTATQLIDLVDALPHVRVWISVDDADVWLNFQSFDMRIDNGVMVGTVDDDSKTLLRRLSIALDAAIIGVMSKEHEDKIEETGKELK